MENARDQNSQNTDKGKQEDFWISTNPEEEEAQNACRNDGKTGRGRDRH